MVQVQTTYVLIAAQMNLAPIEKVFEEAGLSLAEIQSLQSLDLDSVLKLVRNIDKLAYTPIWPAMLGSQVGAVSHGPVGYATLSAPSIGSAIATFFKWFKLRGDIYEEAIVEKEDLFEVSVKDTSSDEVLEYVFFETVAKAMEEMVKNLGTSVASSGTQIHFKRKKPQHLDELKEVFDADIYFGAEENKIVVPKSLWAKKSVLYDKESYELNLRKCQQLLDQGEIENNLAVQMRCLIHDHFENALLSSDPHLPPTQIELCDTLHLTERTLIRKLKDLGTSYKKILEDERKQYSTQLLKDEEYSVCQISDLLGYKESANFCRAFKRWYGVTPTVYRAENN